MARILHRSNGNNLVDYRYMSSASVSLIPSDFKSYKAQSENRLRGRGSRFLLIIILLLYMFTTFGTLSTWVLLTRSFIVNGQNFWTRYETQFSPSLAIYFIQSLAACFCTFLADTSLARPISFCVYNRLTC
ncbi:hypothetical protein IW262DRAFT_129325 [Armillaria fumosa]|nr:hypothetical protein IW262DRAFT_129325 [Armillaria fumosa]